MADKKVWIQNNHTGDIKVRARLPDDDPRVENIAEQLFPNFRQDRMTGRVLQTGYTEITEELFETLKKNSPLFAQFLTDRKFVKYDKPPVGAVSPAEQLVLLHAEIAHLKEQIAAGGGVDEAVFKAEQEKYEALKSEFDKAQKTIDELSVDNDELRKRVDELEAAEESEDSDEDFDLEDEA
jgi:hypothetical protein